MKLPLLPSSSKQKSTSGFALIYALGMVVLAAGLVTAFLVTSRNERTAAGGFAAAVSARQLASNAVNLVQAQINDATTRGTGYAWTSQPGAIQVFDNNGSNLYRAYKLYSAGNMVAEPSQFRISNNQLADDMPPDSWATSPAQWVDLNAPILVDDVTSGSSVPQYPIVDNAALKDIASIRGLEGQGFDIGRVVPVPGGTVSQPVPMPVRWLYVLKNGELVLPSGSGRNATVASASTDNPIVGRVAFWTDDETCKVNINTAGGYIGAEDTFWDMPRATSGQEAAFANDLPREKEYSRHPGHAGTVALSAVLPGLTKTDYPDLTPRYHNDGRRAKADRLYATLDEMAFKSNRAATATLNEDVLKSRRFFLTAHSRAPETTLFNTPRVAMWPVYANLVPNKTSSYDRMIAYCSSLKTRDNTVVPYYIQREQSRPDMLNGSANNDYQNIPRNQQIYSYLSALTKREIPGYGSNFLTKYGPDQEQIITEIFDYIRCTNLFDENLGTTSGNQFTSRWKKDDTTFYQGQGYVTPLRIASNSTQGFGRFLTVTEVGLLFICNASSQDLPTTSFNEALSITKPWVTAVATTLSGSAMPPNSKMLQAALLLELSGVSNGWVALRPLETIEVSNLGGLALVYTGTDINPSTGMPDPQHNYLWLNGGRENNVSPTDLVFGNAYNWESTYASARSGNNPSYRALFFNKNAPLKVNATPNPLGPTVYPFVGRPFIIKHLPDPPNPPAPDPSATPAPNDPYAAVLTDANLVIKIYSGTVKDDSRTLLQTLNVQIPTTVIPLPELVSKGTDQGPTADPIEEEYWWRIENRFAGWESTSGIGKQIRTSANPGGGNLGELEGCLIRSDYDVLRTVLVKHGDFRLLAGKNNVPLGEFQPHRLYHSRARMASNLTSDQRHAPGFDFNGSVGLAQNVYPATAEGRLNAAPDIGQDYNASATLWRTGDFDNGISNSSDGPFINKPDEGPLQEGDPDAYFKHSQRTGGVERFSANRIMPSSGMLGSLSTGVMAGTPWQTLLFRPQASHLQSPESRPGMPPDYLIMDLFWMPSITPYAISERFSTAGKINLNYQILPFTYIERSTGMRAVLKTEKIMAISNGDVDKYKMQKAEDNSGARYRLPVDINATLEQFTDRFQNGNVFRSAAEICSVHIVPEGGNLSEMKSGAFWRDHALTGDNSRERIYTTMYPKLTTKSNTYTVYYRAQSLKKTANTGADATQWIEGRDVVIGEYRGSTTIERFLNSDPDPANAQTAPPDYAANVSTLDNLNTLDKYYKWRVVENRQFAP